MSADLLITIACAVTGCLIGGWLARVFDLPLPRHKCDGRPVAVDHPMIGMLNPAKTVVLWRCPVCGAVETTVVDGRFTLAQVQGEPEETADA